MFTKRIYLLRKVIEFDFLGFYISRSYNDLIEEIDKLILENDEIDKYFDNLEYHYSFTQDLRQTNSIDIFDLDNVVEKEIIFENENEFEINN